MDLILNSLLQAVKDDASRQTIQALIDQHNAMAADQTSQDVWLVVLSISVVLTLGLVTYLAMTSDRQAKRIRELSAHLEAFPERVEVT